MIRARNKGKRSAWLAMIAIWLTIVAPVVSQVLVSRAHASVPSTCAHPMAHMPTACSPDQPQPMTFCGYCSLFHHTSTLTGSLWHPNLPNLLPCPPGVALTRGVPFVHHVLAAAPRGPPMFVPA